MFLNTGNTWLALGPTDALHLTHRGCCGLVPEGQESLAALWQWAQSLRLPPRSPKVASSTLDGVGRLAGPEERALLHKPSPQPFAYFSTRTPGTSVSFSGPGPYLGP